MNKLIKILNDLDWNKPIEIQNKAIREANNIQNLWYFIQPCGAVHNKNIWEGCAKILVNRTNEDLLPYIVPLLEWLQDANWPGFDLIISRMKEIEPHMLVKPFSYCLMRAKERNDIQWLNYLSGLIDNQELYFLLQDEYKIITKQHYAEYWGQF